MRIRDWSSDVCSSDLKGSSCHGFAAKRRSLSAGEFAPPFTDSPPFCRKCCHKAMPSCQKADWILPIASGSKGRFMAVGVLASFSAFRSEEHTSELQSLMRISYAVFCLKKKNQTHKPISIVRQY